MKGWLLLLLLSSNGPKVQDTGLSVLAYKGSDTQKPLLFYISGDGGTGNSFSRAFMEQFHEQGYSILGMDSHRYFWSKKTPQKAAMDISLVLARYLRAWKIKSFVLIGYSFGADVTPFIQRRLSPGLSPLTRHIILMSPSAKTDFEIHVLNMIGWGKSSGISVPGEINKLTAPTTMIFGTSEDSFPIDSIRASNVKTITLPGGHHYHRDIKALVGLIVNAIK
jgi:type IV secretory pathway VirJ component